MGDKDFDFADLFPRNELNDQDIATLSRDNVNPSSPKNFSQNFGQIFTKQCTKVELQGVQLDYMLLPLMQFYYIIRTCNILLLTLLAAVLQDIKKTFLHTSALNSVCVHLSLTEGQNSLIVTGGKDNKITVWDLLTGKSLFTLDGHTDTINSMCIYSPPVASETGSDLNNLTKDSVPLLVSVSKDSTIRVWDLVTGVCIAVFEGHSGSVSCVAIFDPAVNPTFYNTPLVITGCLQDRVPYMWNLKSGNRMRPVQGITEDPAEGTIHSTGICAITIFTPQNGDNRFAVPVLISCSRDKSIILWNLLSGQVMRKIADGQDKISSVAVYCPPTALSAFPTGTKPLLITGSSDKSIVLWDFIAILHPDTAKLAPATPVSGTTTTAAAKKRSSTVNVVPFAQRITPLQVLTGMQSIEALVVYTPPPTVATVARAGASLGAVSGGRSTDLAHKALLVTVGKDRSVAMWDLQERELVKVLDVGHKAAVSAVQLISFDSGNSRPLVVTASADNSAIIWDLLKGCLCIVNILISHSYFNIDFLQLFPFIGGVDIMNVFRPLAMDYITRLSHEKNVKCAAIYSPEEIPGEALRNPLLVTANITSSGENIATVWDINTKDSQVLLNGQEVNGRKRRAHASEITAVAVYCAKKAEAKPVVVTASADCVNVWDLEAHESTSVGKIICAPSEIAPALPNDVVRSLVIYTPRVESEGGPVVIVAYGTSILIMDLFGGQNCRVIPKAHAKPVSCLTVYDPPHDRCNPLLISAGKDRCVYVWDLHTEQKSSIVLKCDDIVDALALFAPEDDSISPLILTAGGDKPAVVFWDLMSGERVRILQCGKPVHSLSLCAPANVTSKGVMPILVTASYAGAISLFDFHTGALIRTLDGVHPKRLSCMTVYPYCGADGCLPIVVSGSVDGSAVIWNLNSADSKHTKTMESSMIQNVAAVALYVPARGDASHRARIVTANGENGQVHVSESLEKKKGPETQQISKRGKEHKLPITCMALYSPLDVALSPLVITGSKDQTAQVYDLTTGELLYSLTGAHSKPITSLVVCPPAPAATNGVSTAGNNAQVVTGSLDGTAVVWDLTTGKQVSVIPENLVDRRQGITAVAVHRPPEAGAPPLLVACYADSSALVWNMSTGKKRAKLLGGHNTAIRAITIASIVPTLASEIRYAAAITAGEEGDVVMWKLPTGDKLRVFTGAHSPGTMMLSTFAAPGHSSLHALITGCTGDKHVTLWDLTSGKLLRKVELQAVLHQARRGRHDVVQIANITALAVSACDDKRDPLSFQVCVSYGAKKVSVVVWREMLLDYMPLPAAVQAQFLSDASTVPVTWGRLKELSSKYETALWMENYALFKTIFGNKKFRLIISFYTTFAEELPAVVFRLPIFDSKTTNKSVLHYVIDNKMPVRHHLLDAWATAIASKCNTDYVLQLFHPSNYLDLQGLLRLSAMFPMDFIEFLSKLKPVQSHVLVFKGCQSYCINSSSGAILEGTKARISVDLWTTAGYTTDTTSSSAQPVTAYMLPLVGAANFNMLKAYIDTSLAMDNLAVFESEMGASVFRFAWQSFGKPVHLRTMLWYCAFMAVYTSSVFLFDKMQTSGDMSMQVGAWILQAAVLLFAVSLGVDEVLQFLEDWDEKKSQVSRAAELESDQKSEPTKGANTKALSSSMVSTHASSASFPLSVGNSPRGDANRAPTFTSVPSRIPKMNKWETAVDVDSVQGGESAAHAGTGRANASVSGISSQGAVDVSPEFIRESASLPTTAARPEGEIVTTIARAPTKVRALKRGSVLSKHFPEKEPDSDVACDDQAAPAHVGWAHQTRSILYNWCFNVPSLAVTAAVRSVAPYCQGWLSIYGALRHPLAAVLEHMSNFWNLLDVLLIVFVTAGTILRCIYVRETNQSRCVLAVASVFTWFKMLYFMRPFEASGLLGKFASFIIFALFLLQF